VCAYLTKPVEPDDLCFAVAQAIGPIAPSVSHSRSQPR
jgi:hypothetical protein